MEPALEKRLIARAQQGDMAAYEQLYRAHKDGLYHRVIRPRTASAADADDVLVDTFTTALTRLGSFQWQGVGLFAWLARIAVNKCHDLGRGAARDARRRDALAQVENTPPPRPDERVGRQMAQEVARDRVEQVLAELNPRYAEALRLRVLEERPREDCARALEVKLGTFDVLVLRATRSFRKAWVARYGEDMGERG